MALQRILVIEDDPDVRDTVSGVLETVYPQAQVTALADGHEFLEVFGRVSKWDLIVLDIMLPDLSGIEICKRIRATEDGKDTPVLAMTGYDTPEMEKRVRAVGASAFLAKPFEISDFLKTVRSITA